MPCPDKLRHYQLPNTNIILEVCDACVKEAVVEINRMTPGDRIAFTRFMDSTLPELDLDSLEMIEKDLYDRWGDYLVLYVAYEIEFGEGIKSNDGI